MKLITTILFALIALLVVGCGGNSVEPVDTSTRGPFGMTLTLPTNYTAGQTITGTVTLTGPAVGDQVITIGSTPAGSFSSIPATVTVPNGATSVSFSATMSSTPPSQVTVTATANGRTVSRAMWGV